MARFGLQLGAQVALARMLGPGNYGVYGNALTILTFLGVWADYLWPSFTVAGHEELYPIALRMKTLLVAEVSSSGIVDYPSILIKTFLATWPPAAPGWRCCSASRRCDYGPTTSRS